ncbi:MAG: hypothetical protein Q8P46_06415, partial [Hyphomicrobiales bacterium]|nr:hypothetical protein [Hyphomicrobiales bacterium]
MNLAQGAIGQSGDWIDAAVTWTVDLAKGTADAIADWLEKTLEWAVNLAQGASSLAGEWLRRSVDWTVNLIQGTAAPVSEWIGRRVQWLIDLVPSPETRTGVFLDSLLGRPLDEATVMSIRFQALAEGLDPDEAVQQAQIPDWLREVQARVDALQPHQIQMGMQVTMTVASILTARFIGGLIAGLGALAWGSLLAPGAVWTAGAAGAVLGTLAVPLTMALAISLAFDWAQTQVDRKIFDTSLERVLAGAFAGMGFKFLAGVAGVAGWQVTLGMALVMAVTLIDWDLALAEVKSLWDAVKAELTKRFADWTMGDDSISIPVRALRLVFGTVEPQMDAQGVNTLQQEMERGREEAQRSDAETRTLPSVLEQLTRPMAPPEEVPAPLDVRAEISRPPSVVRLEPSKDMLAVLRQQESSGLPALATGGPFQLRATALEDLLAAGLGEGLRSAGNIVQGSLADLTKGGEDFSRILAGRFLQDQEAMAQVQRLNAQAADTAIGFLTAAEAFSIAWVTGLRGFKDLESLDEVITIVAGQTQTAMERVQQFRRSARDIGIDPGTVSLSELGEYRSGAGRGMFAAASVDNASADVLADFLEREADLRGFQEGARLTGTGPAHEVAGVVHNREAVIPWKALRKGLQGVLEFLGVPGFDDGAGKNILAGIDPGLAAGIREQQGMIASLQRAMETIPRVIMAGMLQMLQTVGEVLMNLAGAFLSESQMEELRASIDFLKEKANEAAIALGLIEHPAKGMERRIGQASADIMEFGENVSEFGTGISSSKQMLQQRLAQYGQAISRSIQATIAFAAQGPTRLLDAMQAAGSGIASVWRDPGQALASTALLALNGIEALGRGAASMGKAAFAELKELGRKATQSGKDLLALANPAMLLGHVLEQLAPTAQVLAAVMEPLEPIIAALAQPLIVFGKAFGEALVPLLEALFPVFKGVAIVATFLGQAFFWLLAVVSDVVGGIATFVGGIIKGIGDFLGSIKVFGIRPFGLLADALSAVGGGLKAFGDGAKGFAEGARKGADAMADARGVIANMTLADAKALAEHEKVTREATAAMRNLPFGVKV